VLDAETLSSLEEGADVILCAGPHKGSWKCPNYTWWSPVVAFLGSGFKGELGREIELAEKLVEELLVFDLLSGRVLASAKGMQHLIEVRDAHMEPGKMIRRPLVGTMRVGKGRLLVSAMRHDTPAGNWLLEHLARRLESSDPPVIGSIAPAAGPDRLPVGSDRLAAGSDRLAVGRIAPADSAVLDDWEMSFDGRSWVHVKCDTALANKGLNVFEGWALFKASFVIPDHWHGREAVLRCEAVGDAFIIAIDGREIGRAGNPTGIFDGTRDKPVEFHLTLETGDHEIGVRVRDWRGNGGMIGPVFFTITPESLIY
jgi:hypothetical protein